MTEQALRECPFCGTKQVRFFIGEDGESCVDCDGDCCFTITWYGSSELLESWNTRAYDAEREELMRVKREYEKLKTTLDEAKILAALVSEYDLLDTSPLNYESLGIELSDRVLRAWHALELLRNY